MGREIRRVLSKKLKRVTHLLDERAVARFWSKVVPKGDCLLWTAALDADGYGRFSLGREMVPAHQVSFLLKVGRLPDQTLDLDHTCRIRKCVAVPHLEEVSHRVNTQRGLVGKYVHKLRTHCLKGHALSGANLLLEKNREVVVRRCLACKQAARKGT